MSKTDLEALEGCHQKPETTTFLVAVSQTAACSIKVCSWEMLASEATMEFVNGCFTSGHVLSSASRQATIVTNRSMCGWLRLYTLGVFKGKPKGTLASWGFPYFNHCSLYAINKGTYCWDGFLVPSGVLWPLDSSSILVACSCTTTPCRWHAGGIAPARLQACIAAPPKGRTSAEHMKIWAWNWGLFHCRFPF